MTYDLALLRAALISVGYFYEDYDGSLTDDEIEAAKRIIAERESRNFVPTAAE